jgi:hypothetical protein
VDRPHLIVGNSAGNLIEIPGIYMAGMNLVKPALPREADLIPVPDDLQIITLPGRVAIGYDPDLEKFVQIREYDSTPVFPVAAVLPPPYLQILRSAFSIVLDAPRLPNQNYSAVGCLNQTYFAAALKVDQRLFDNFNILELNPLLESPSEMIEAGLQHLLHAPNALVNLDISEEVNLDAVSNLIQSIRQQTFRGMIQINASAPDPRSIKKWCEAGLDSIRLTLNSAQGNYYNLFHEPQESRFDDIVESFKIARYFHRRAVLNYEIFPGLTDHPAEIDALIKLVRELKIETIQLHNLKIDPEWYMDELQLLNLTRKQIGIQNWFTHLQKTFPAIQIGYYDRSPETVVQ